MCLLCNLLYGMYQYTRWKNRKQLVLDEFTLNYLRIYLSFSTFFLSWEELLITKSFKMSKIKTCWMNQITGAIECFSVFQIKTYYIKMYPLCKCGSISIRTSKMVFTSLLKKRNNKIIPESIVRNKISFTFI